MKLKRLVVSRFRGIRDLDWTVDGSTICLIGPGDSTKTTILDAIEWSLSSRWSLPISDADFYGMVTSQPILIEATVGDVPPSLLRQQKYGLEQRGWGIDGLHDEPEDDDEPVITVRLTIDDSLEPTWEVVNDRQPEPRTISARERESLGASRLGSDVERHLTWGRGSALLRLTDSTEEMVRTLADAHRSSRGAVDGAQLVKLKEAAERASEGARAMGAGVRGTYLPGLDPATVGLGASALGLQDGAVPVRAAGLGSRRLSALAIQRASFPDGGIMLVDEVESGLEPHRLRHVLRELADPAGQIVMTTHSEIPIVELTVAEMRIVASEAGVTTVRRVGDELQAAIRAVPEALLGRRVIVGEGKTEVGLCRALDTFWTEARGKPPAEVGIVVVPGNGAEAARRAMGFASLGYPTALLVDSDVELSPEEAEVTKAGVAVFKWSGGVCTEERVMNDVPMNVVIHLVILAAELVDEYVSTAVTDAIASRLGAPAGTGPEDWVASFGEKDIRQAVAQAAKKQSWFKRIDMGESLGQAVVAALPDISDSDLARKLQALADWAYAS